MGEFICDAVEGFREANQNKSWWHSDYPSFWQVHTDTELLPESLLWSFRNSLSRPMIGPVDVVYSVQS
jgi:hypothetical protein